jgi:hypothetical protein
VTAAARLPRVALVSGAVTLGLVALVCLSPLRFDAKVLGPTLPRTTTGPLPLGASIVFVSADNGGAAGHVARYGLDLVTFPAGKGRWLAFRDGVMPGPWPPDGLLEEGRTWPETAAGAIVLASSTRVGERLLTSWPELRDRVRILDPVRPPLLARPGWRLSLGDVLRLAAFVFVLVAAADLGARVATPLGRSCLGAALALPCVLAAHVGLVLVAGRFTDRPFPWAIGLEALALALLHWLGPAPDAAPFSKRAAACAGVVAALYLGLVVTRLDFDGDLFTHWLPMARSHLLHGRHDPAVLLERYGLAHQATYPPAFPVLISTLLWVAGSDPRASLQPGQDAHEAILLYRVLLAVLALGFVAGAASLTRSLARERSVGLLALLGLPLLLPVLLGRPTGAEVFLVPILGTAILALWAGGSLGSAGLTSAGLFLAASGLLVKREAALAVPLVVLPWIATGDRHLWRRPLTWAVAALGLLPFVLWRFDMATLGVRENFMFDDVDPGRLGARTLARVAAVGLRAVLADSACVALLLVLPAAALHVARSRNWRGLLPAVGVASYAAAMLGAYAFTRSDPAQHIAASYDRVLMIAVASAALYGLRALCDAGPDAAAGAG